MEWVILTVGLSAVVAAWDAHRRSVESSSTARRGSEYVDVLAARVDKLEQRANAYEADASKTRTHVADLKNFMSTSKARR